MKAPERQARNEWIIDHYLRGMGPQEIAALLPARWGTIQEKAVGMVIRRYKRNNGIGKDDLSLKRIRAEIDGVHCRPVPGEHKCKTGGVPHVQGRDNHPAGVGRRQVPVLWRDWIVPAVNHGTVLALEVSRLRQRNQYQNAGRQAPELVPGLREQGRNGGSDMKYNLDTAAIYNRISKQAVVIKPKGLSDFKEGQLDIGAPQDGGCYTSLTTGKAWDLSDPLHKIDWLIRPGDEAEFSDDGEEWVSDVYDGFCVATVDDPRPFIAKKARYWGYIRPIPQADPELVKAREEVAEAQKEILKARRKLEQAEARLNRATDSLT